PGCCTRQRVRGGLLPAQPPALRIRVPDVFDALFVHGRGAPGPDDSEGGGDRAGDIRLEGRPCAASGARGLALPAPQPRALGARAGGVLSRRMDLSVSWVTEVPTPYRNYRYVRMAEIFPRHGIGFDVRYLAWTVPGRYWVFEDEDFGYPYRVFAGIHPRVLGIDMHANPSLLWRLLRKPTDVVVVGGYNSPTLALSPFCSRNSIRLLESESTPQSARWTAGPAGWIKRALLHRYDGYMGPGPRSFDLLCQLDPAAAAKPFIEFPNLIDERVFRDGV